MQLQTHSPTTAARSARRSSSAGERREGRDYVAIAVRYAEAAQRPDASKKFCYWMRLATKRFLEDLKRAKGKHAPFTFDRWSANDPCNFLEKLPHVEGVWGTPTIELHPSDVFFLVNLFGFRTHEGTRRFTTALKAIGRKNAKSTIAAGIALYCQVCEGEEGPQVLTAATTGQQARVVFSIAQRMVERTSALRTQFSMEPFRHAIASYRNGGTCKPINAKASTQDGLNPSVVILDEIHAHKTHDLLNVLRSAAGARGNPLFLYCTTEGYQNTGPWGELRHFAKQVLEGVLEADHFLAVYYTLDDENKADGTPADDDFDESKWIKANPLMDVNPLLMREIRKEAVEAKAMPGRHAEFRIKRLNRASAVAGGFINISKWRACGAGAVDLDWLQQFPCYGGLDLASVRDLASFRLAWLVEGIWYTHGWRFVPGGAVKERTERGLVPYHAWLQSGVLIEAGVEAIDYDVIERAILEAHERFKIRAVGYDTWNSRQLAPKLIAAGVALEEFIQGPRSYHPAMQALERAYVSGQLRHGNDPVLNWNASNLVARYDQNLNSAPDKKHAKEKIDDMVALLMAIGTATKHAAEAPAPKPAIRFW
jgi:phage terminase large subunit-like protein